METALGVAGPLVAGAVAIEFDPVAIGVAEVEGFADAMVGGALQRDAGCDEALESVGEFGAVWIEDCEVIKAGAVRGRRRGAAALPCIEGYVMVIAAGGKEGGLRHPLRYLEAENAVIEGEGAFNIGHFQMNVADMRLGMDGRGLLPDRGRCGHVLVIRGEGWR